MLAPSSKFLYLLQSIADELCCWLMLQSATGVGHSANHFRALLLQCSAAAQYRKANK
jgi:hypothetical protein